jgi:hypothetical protein
MLKRLKFDIESLVTEMLGGLPTSVWESNTTTFLDPAMGGGQFVKLIEETLRVYGHSTKNIKSRVFGLESSQMRVNYAVNKHELVGTYTSTDFLSWETDMKFDVVLGNPPYQKKRGDSDATIAIWDKFVFKAFNHLKDGGYLALIHPSGWRNASGRFSEVHDLLLSKQMEYLEIHSVKDGIKTFGASTRYDWYIVKNNDSKINSTTVVFEDGQVQEVNLKNLPFIPNHSYEKIEQLVAGPEEETVQVLHSFSAYFCRGQNYKSKNHVNHTKTKKFKYPVVYGVSSIDDSLVLKWSSDNTKGHFGKPKLIWSESGGIATAGSVVDISGEYGLTQFAYAIVDTPENLPLIKKAFDSKEFRNICEAVSINRNIIDYKTISTFRKDFWKEFV